MRLVIIASLVLVVVSTPNRPSPVPLPAVSLGRWLLAPLEQRWALVQGRWQHPSWQIDNE